MPKQIIRAIIFIILFVFIDKGYCLNIDRVKVNFLSGDYKAAILEGEKALASTSETGDLSELYYILGLSYLKDGNYLRASDIFEIILKELKNSKFRQEAKLALGDTYFLRSDYLKAQSYYKEIAHDNLENRLMPLVYYRLSQCAIKTGDTKEAKVYLDKLKKDFPLSAEGILNKELYGSSDIYYTVQVGSFSRYDNARGLVEKLTQKGYPAYIEDSTAAGKASYRVRVGKMALRQEALDLERKLSQEGYPTKIFP